MRSVRHILCCYSLIVASLALTSCGAVGGGGGANNNGGGVVAPSIVTQPTSQTVTVGQTATFTVIATGSSPLSYQWQKNSVAMSGAISAEYTTPVTVSADNGSQFTVVVSNVAGNRTSNAAILTVNLPPPTISSVVVSPNPVSISISGSQQFSALVTGTGNFSTAVTWQVNGVTGGNSAVGTIDSAGLYTAPATVPSPATVTVAARSIQDSTKSGTASLTIMVPAITQQSFATGADGLATFSSANLAIHVIDLVTEQPLQGIEVTLLQQGTQQGVVVVDLAGRYAGSIFLVGGFPQLAAARSSIQLVANSQSPVNTVDVNLVSTQFLTSAKSTVPVALTGSMWDDLTKLFWTCQTAPLSQAEDSLKTFANNLITEHFVSLEATTRVELVLKQVAPEVLEAVSGVGVATAITNLGAAGLSGLALLLYKNLGYRDTDSFSICSVNLNNPLAAGVLDHYFELKPLGPPSGVPSGTGSIGGTVKDAATGAPIPGASVQLAGPTPSGLSTADGQFTFSNLIASSTAEYALSAYVPGYVPGGRLLTLSSGQSLTGQDILLGRPGPKSSAPAGSLSVLVQGTNVSSYVPNGSFTESALGVQLVPIEGTGVARASIATPQPVNSCSSNGATGKTICTANNTDIYVLKGAILESTLTSSGSGTARFSGGPCTNCGVVVDPATNTAIIGISRSGSPAAYQLLDLSANSLDPPIPATATTISETFGLSAVPSRFILSPIEARSGFPANYQIFDINLPGSPQLFNFAGAGTIFPFSADLDSAAADNTTGIMLATDEGTTNLFIADLTQATFTPASGGSPGTWQAPSQLQNLPEFGSFISGSGTTAITIAPGAHLGLLEDEFGIDAFGAIQLPSTSGAGTPAVSDWVVARMPLDPTGTSWLMPLDPHGVTSYVSPASGKAMALLMNKQRTFIAVIDLKALLAAPRSPAHMVASPVDLVSTGVVRFVSIQ